MTDTDRLILQVLPAADGDAEELADLAGGLCAELLAADVASVAPLTDDAVPARAKGVGTLAGWLVAQFGTLDGLRAAVTAVRGCMYTDAGLRRLRAPAQDAADLALILADPGIGGLPSPP